MLPQLTSVQCKQCHAHFRNLLRCVFFTHRILYSENTNSVTTSGPKKRTLLLREKQHNVLDFVLSVVLLRTNHTIERKTT